MSTVTTIPSPNPLLRDFFSHSAWLLFLVSCLSYALVLYLQERYVLTEQVYYNTLGEQLTIERIDAFLQARAKWAWLSYAIIPVVLFLQALLVSICLSTGAILLDYKVKFGALFGVVVRAMVIYALGKVVYMMIVQFIEIQTVNDLMHADFFSLLGWVGAAAIPRWLHYPLSVVNVFEFGFWLLLAGGMSYLLQKRWTQMLGFVAATYGVGLLVWVLFIVFLQLNLE